MEQQCINALIDLEPAIRRAGDAAMEMRATAKASNKFSTGNHDIDIVTEADLKVQEIVLKTFLDDPVLADCRLVAEESTPLVDSFKGGNKLILTLDPIDGTALYAGDGRFYSVIVGLHNGEKPLYTFCYYPEVQWSRRIANGKITDFGQLPTVVMKPGGHDMTIAYTYGEPETRAKDLYESLIAQGYAFKKRHEVSDDSGAHTLLFLNQIGGYYVGNPNVYDGICGLHCAQVRGDTIYSDLDLSEPVIGQRGKYYKGWYIVIPSK